MHIAVIGSGYVGLVTGACFAEFGVDVTCVDIDANKIKTLTRGETTIYEPGLEQLIQKNLEANRLRFTTDIPAAVQSALVVFLAVGTPSLPDGSADLTYLENAAQTIAQHINSYKVIATKSTVPVGTGKYLESLIRNSQARAVPFSVVSNPEFLREGAAISDFMRPDRVVIGSNDVEATEIMRDLYRPLFLIETPIVITSVEGAELIKYAANAFLATKISFINELATLCEHVRADAVDLALALGLDKKIAPRCFQPGTSIGGPFVEAEMESLAQLAVSNGVSLKILSAAREVNQSLCERIMTKLSSALQSLQGKQVGLLGLAF